MSPKHLHLVTYVLVAGVLATACASPNPAPAISAPATEAAPTEAPPTSAPTAAPTEVPAETPTAEAISVAVDGVRTYGFDALVMVSNDGSKAGEPAAHNEVHWTWTNLIAAAARCSDLLRDQSPEYAWLIDEVVHFLNDPASGVLEPAEDGTATVRVNGMLRPIPFADELASALAPANYDDLAVALDYSLAPGASHVSVRVQLSSPRTGRARGNYRKFKLCRIKLRELASVGQIPGMVKASW